MVTRSKNGVFKPKLYSSTISGESACQNSSDMSEVEPQNIHEAFKDPLWKAAVLAEYEALQRNNTWSVVRLPEGRTVGGYFESSVMLMARYKNIKPDLLLKDSHKCLVRIFKNVPLL
ncbi:uncharacterized mitochondrial protein AtMg00820-like [Hibiscus syriacus]|uniref:uncharacterized mitochondrial protein AtMg00820-like n=1 Tax=Hibiscus syriacus TaxID=106335 RepID=UPI001921A911|nr:uncharacterized mitochondrial protein AtMg00820-like [Hibiscus syriacus]